MAKKTQITKEMRETFAALAAEGCSNIKIAERMAITRYTATKLRDDHDTNVAIDRVRLTETMPRQLSALIDVVTDLAQTVASLRNDVCDVNVTQKKVAKAMTRLQVENKNLREERRKAREDVRRLKSELWKARGY
ncbi:hypothetical protein [Sphingobium sp.]|uniref:hypothetical protein n=1 Tax=Sphingobium sp. TaxID=1912891 RepID=UPI002607DB9C|nr:hypothetical protein [Sphingobium sp.]